jgi:hypothetical protein
MILESRCAQVGLVTSWHVVYELVVNGRGVVM